MSEQEHLRRIRSFSLRGARLGDKYEQLMAEHGSQYVIDFPAGDGIATIARDARIDFAAEFRRSGAPADVQDAVRLSCGTNELPKQSRAVESSECSMLARPLIVEVGPGSGEQLAASAIAHPERDYLGLEAWAPGVARCVKTALAAGVTNVRIMELDAAQGLPILFGPESPNMHAAEVWTFFPDPWRKRKHRKRRIVSPEFAHIVAGVLREGGVWRLATDWANYAWQMRDVLVESPWFDLVSAENVPDGGASAEPDLGIYDGGWAPRWGERVTTRFEERGIEAGRHVYDLVAVRNGVPIDAEPVPCDPWVAAQARGETVYADQPGVTPNASSRSGWLKEQAVLAQAVTMDEAMGKGNVPDENRD